MNLSDVQSLFGLDSNLEAPIFKSHNIFLEYNNDALERTRW